MNTPPTATPDPLNHAAATAGIDAAGIDAAGIDAAGIDAGAAAGGFRQAEELLRKIAADPLAPFILTIIGPGGCGKTTVLGALAQLCTLFRVRICGLDAARRVLDDPGHGVVLVDNAHQIDAAGLDLIGLLAQTPGARLAVAYRPWPRQAALDVLALARPPVVLGHLDRPQIADRARMLLGHPPTPAVLDWLRARTAGLPRLVDQLVLALRDCGAVEQPAPQVEAGIIEQLRDELREELRDGRNSLGPGVFRLLLARALGATADAGLLAEVLDMPPAEVSELFDAARASGLVDPEGALVPLVREAITSLASAIAAGAPGQRCIAHRAEAAALDGNLDEALRLADQVIADPTAVDRERGTLVAAAVLAHRGLLPRSAELYRWLDSMQPGTAAALAVVALVGMGELVQAGTVLDGPDGLPDQPPTLLAGAQSLMARGLYESVTGSPAAALSTLTRAATLLEPSGRTAMLPDTPAALAGLVALHLGHFDVAESVLGRAVECQLGGRLAETRHQLLQAWTAMLRGDYSLAHALLGRCTPGNSTSGNQTSGNQTSGNQTPRNGTAGNGAAADGWLEPRDELLAAALQVGLARRESDQRALHDAWRRARQATVRHPVDLLALLPFGELAIGAARLREQGWLATQLAEAHALLDRLGNPPLWAVPLHWNALHAAIIAQQPQEAKRQAEALAAAAHQHSPAAPYATVLAAAGDSWLQVMDGVIDAAEVEAAARSLHGAGLSWEGSRLAGQAAIRTTNRKEMSALLALARGLHRGALGPPPAPPAPPAQDGARESTAPGNTGPGSAGSSGTGRGSTGPDNTGRSTTGPGGALTGREREIATLLLAGLTYKQIGERLFISAKTVEHHVARMRQRLGAEDRAELLAQLRRAVADTS